MFTPSVLLERELRALNASTYLIGHGCGSEHLDYRDDGNVPEDLQAVPEPRVVYAGTLANWVDYRLLTEIACGLPGVSFVLIGYIHALAPRDDVNRLCALPNVHHLGYKNFADLPRYYRRASVAIVPYQPDNEHIRYSTPTKFMDYLAGGLPVVSTRFPAAELMKDVVETSSTPNEFAAAIRRALKEGPPEEARRRRAYAENRTWERQVASMCRHIQKHLQTP